LKDARKLFAKSFLAVGWSGAPNIIKYNKIIIREKLS